MLMAKIKRYDVGNDVHYKKLVSTVGQKKTITTNNDIYTETGQKLVAKGVKIDNKVSASLAKHKLQAPLDDFIEIENPITAMTVVDDIKRIIAGSRTLKILLDDLRDTDSIESTIGSHNFPPTIAFKLSIAKSEREDIYDHSLMILCLAYFIASKANLSKNQLESTLLAALFHDIGLLHIDPAYFKSGRKLTSNERKFLNVHVIISSLILEPYSEYKGVISRTVLDHHERMDGSGYPNGKSGDEICVSGQVLAIAEVVGSKFNADYECVDVDELELLLNMNSRKLNSELYTYFSVLFGNEQKEVPSNISLSELEMKDKLLLLAEILKKWLSISNKQSSSTLAFIASYIDTLYESLIQAGMNFESLDFLIMMIEQDDVMKRHTYTIIKESSWQLSNLIEELKRRNKYQETVKDNSLSEWLLSIEKFTV